VTVGPVSNARGRLSVARRLAGHGVVQRALPVADIVVIDVFAGSTTQSDFMSEAAVNIARQIAASVPRS
jgi:hypothetical protein